MNLRRDRLTRSACVALVLLATSMLSPPVQAQDAQADWSVRAEAGEVAARYNLPVAEAITLERLREAQRRAQTPSTTGTDTALSAPAPVAAAQDHDVTLHDLRLSEGPPESGFMFAALAGALPSGNVSLAPAFEPGVIAYSAGVSQPLLTIRARAAAGMTMSVTGMAAGGAALSSVNQSRIGNANDHGAFISVTLSGLAPGENTIRISTSGQTYTVFVTREPDAGPDPPTPDPLPALTVDAPAASSPAPAPNADQLLADAVAAEMAGEADTALDLYGRVLDLNANNPTARAARQRVKVGVAEERLRQANAAFAAGQYDDARRFFHDALALDSSPEATAGLERVESAETLTCRNPVSNRVIGWRSADCGTLVVRVAPAAEIFIDDRSLGIATELKLSLHTGRHRVRLETNE